MPSSRSSNQEARAAYERAMARLRATIFVLGVVVLALVARGVVDGLTVAVVVAALVCAVALFAAAVGWRNGRRLG
jgi:di/tricarboxylate transporter